MKHFLPPHQPQPLDHPGLRTLANFRYQLRKFLRFSEGAARSNGLTPQQHQLLLGIAGFTGQGWATITELAEFLQERHNAVVGLVQRAERCGLVHKEHDTCDKRYVFVSLTPRGEAVLSKLAKLHKQEIGRLQAGLLTPERLGRSLDSSEQSIGKKR